jgi:hypothetical protein
VVLAIIIFIVVMWRKGMWGSKSDSTLITTEKEKKVCALVEYKKIMRKKCVSRITIKPTMVTSGERFCHLTIGIRF